MEAELFSPATVTELQNWFAKKHKATTAAWIVIYKKSTKKQVVTLEDIIEESICNGWIDSKVKSIDIEKYAIYITPRRVNSHWTQRNKHIAEKMIVEGRMTVRGMDVFATGT